MSQSRPFTSAMQQLHDCTRAAMQPFAGGETTAETLKQAATHLNSQLRPPASEHVEFVAIADSKDPTVMHVSLAALTVSGEAMIQAIRCGRIA